MLRASPRRYESLDGARLLPDHVCTANLTEEYVKLRTSRHWKLLESWALGVLEQTYQKDEKPNALPILGFMQRELGQSLTFPDDFSMLESGKKCILCRRIVNRVGIGNIRVRVTVMPPVPAPPLHPTTQDTPIQHGPPVTKSKWTLPNSD